MIKYEGHFKNENYDIDIDIINSECGNSPISFEVEGVSFIGDIISFELENPEKYNISKLPFKIMKCGGVTLTKRSYQDSNNELKQVPFRYKAYNKKGDTSPIV